MKKSKTDKKICEDCGGKLEGYKFDISFCERCGCKRERYFIEDNNKRSAEMNSAGIVLSFVGILSGFIFAIFLLLFKSYLVGILKIVTYFSLIASISILLILCFFLLHTVINVKNGYLHTLNWLEDVLHILYVPFGLMLTTLLLISWKAHWGYALACFIIIFSMFIFVRYKLGYEESIKKYINRIDKQNVVHKYEIGLIDSWIIYLFENKLIAKKELAYLTGRLEKLKLKQLSTEKDTV